MKKVSPEPKDENKTEGREAAGPAVETEEEKDPGIDETIDSAEKREFKKSSMSVRDQLKYLHRKSMASRKSNAASFHESVARTSRVSKHSVQTGEPGRGSEYARFSFLRKSVMELQQHTFKYNPRVTYVEDIERPTTFQQKCAFTTDPYWFRIVRAVMVILIIWMAIDDTDFTQVQNFRNGFLLTLYVIYLWDLTMSFATQYLISMPYIIPNPVFKPLWIYIIDVAILVPLQLIITNSDNKALNIFLRWKHSLLIIRLVYEFSRKGLLLETSVLSRLTELIVVTVCARVSISTLVFLINDIEVNNFWDVDWMEFKSTLFDRNLGVFQVEVPIIINIYIVNLCIYMPSLCLVMFTYCFNNAPKYAYISHVRLFQTVLVSRYGISQENSTKVLKYLKLRWETRPDFMFQTAAFLEGNCYVTTYQAMMQDRNLYMLQHCPMLKDFEYYILRYLAQKVTTQMYMKGMNLYKFPLRKLAMFYIASGELHLLSNEDGQTPIIKLKEGTCVGSIALLRPYRSNATLCTGTECEIYELSAKSFCDLARRFPNEYRMCVKFLEEKIEQAAYLKMLKLMHQPRAIDNTIKWIKKEQHRLMGFTAESAADHKLANIYLMDRDEDNSLADIIYTKINLACLSIKPRYSQYTDLVFIRATCCWLFQPDSPMRSLIWKIVFVTSIVSYVIIVYEKLLGKVLLLSMILGVCILTMCIELLILCMTPLTLHTSRHFGVIFLARCQKVTFIADLFTIFFSLRCLGNTDDMQAYVIIPIAAIRLWRFVAVYHHIETNVVKHLFFFQVLCFVGLYILLWFNFGVIYQEYLHQNFFMTYEALVGAIEQTLPLQNGVTIHLFPNQLLKFLIGIVIACSFHLLRDDSIKIANALTITERFKNSGPIPKRNPSLTKRLRSFLAFYIHDYHYLQLKAHQEKHMQFPDYINQLIKPEALLHYLSLSRFFGRLPNDMLHELSTHCNVEAFYESAVILQRGLRSKYFYVLIKGQVYNVELKQVHKVQKTADLNCLEMLLDLPTARHYIAFSHTIVISIEYDVFKQLLVKFPITHEIIQGTLKTYEEEYMEELQEITYGKPTVIIEVSRVPDVTSFNVFKCVMYRDSFEAFDFFPPFDRLGIFAFVRFFLLRITFHPEGMFFVYWEKFRLACVCTGVVIYLIPSYILRRIEMYALFFDLIGFIDIYIRLHVCYYNSDGILVKHPAYTAFHYLTSSFVVDLVSVLPLQFYSDFTIFRSLIRALRSLQLYRLLGYFYYTYTRHYMVTLICLMYYMSILVVALSTLTFELHCRDSTIYKLNCPGFNDEEAANLYLTIVYLTAVDLSGIGSQRMALRKTLQSAWTQRFFAAMLFVGIFWRAICLGKTFNEYMSNHLYANKKSVEFRKLMNFMKAHRMNKKVRAHVLEYFNIQWSWVERNNIDFVLTHMNLNLKRDLLFHVYGDPFIRYNTFTSDYRNLINFFKDVFLKTHSKVCPTFGKFISFNDVGSTLYFIYQGAVDIIDTRKDLLATLYSGSVFGNLEEKTESRHLITAIAKCNTHCLCIKSADLYNIFPLYEKIEKGFKRVAARKRYFIKSKARTTVKHQFLSKRKRSRLWFLEKLMSVHLILCCYVGILLNFYQIATGEDQLIFIIVLYFLDVLHVYGILVKYVKPVKNEFGSWCVHVKDIYKAEGSKVGITMDVISSLPIDFIFLMIGYTNISEYMYSVMRINRICRTYYIIKHYTQLTSSFMQSYKHIIKKTLVVWYEFVYFCFLLTTVFMWIDMNLPGNVFELTKRSDVDLESIKEFRTKPSAYRLRIFLLYFRVFTETAVLEHSVYYETKSVFIHVTFAIVLFACYAMNLIVMCHFYGVIYDLYLRNAYVWTIMFNNVLKYSKCYTRYIKERVLMNSRYVFSRDNWLSYRALSLAPTPNYLIELVMNTCYGAYLTRHPIFQFCHPDFLRQVGKEFKLVEIPKGVEVIHKHDDRACMFFIVKGSVAALKEDDDIIENYMYLLGPGDCFCFRLGFHQEQEARCTYTCRVNTIMLELEYHKWSHLVTYFPATADILRGIGYKLKDHEYLRLKLPRKLRKKAKDEERIRKFSFHDWKTIARLAKDGVSSDAQKK